MISKANNKGLNEYKTLVTKNLCTKVIW